MEGVLFPFSPWPKDQRPLLISSFKMGSRKVARAVLVKLAGAAEQAEVVPST
jgi:hypothetical protein